jgi:ribonuclease HII
LDSSGFEANCDRPWVAGVDEVGRGALFGPVVTAAVILTPEATHTLRQLGVTDSKGLRPQQRETLAIAIQDLATGYALGMARVWEVERFNVLQASLLAMKRAVSRLSPVPALCLIDGNQPIPQLAIPQRTVVKGDQTETSIAAASIVAKVWRDALMVRLDQRYPGYDLASNKGYGSARHRTAIACLGLSPQHRLSFCRKLQLPDENHP